MKKRSAFVEGMLSAMVLMPSMNHASPYFIEPTKINIESAQPLAEKEPWVQVGGQMRKIAQQQIEQLAKNKQAQLRDML